MNALLNIPSQTAAKPVTVKTVSVAATAPRGGRITPQLKADVLKLVSAKNGATCKVLADKLNVPERDIRLAIDGLRAKGYAKENADGIKNVSGVFIRDASAAKPAKAAK